MKKAIPKFKKIDLKQDYNITKILGSGSCGKVLKAFKKDSKTPRALKVIDFNPTSFSHTVYRELATWKRVSKYPKCSQYVVCLYDFGLTTDRKYIVLEMEFLPNSTSLGKYAKKYEYDEIPAITFKHIFVSLVKGLKYIHKKNVFHRDIKLENIMIMNKNSQKPTIKYIDFGLSCVNWTEQCLEELGSPIYLSPDFIETIISKNKKLTSHKLKAADIYALGVTMYLLYHFQHPYLDIIEKAHDTQNRNLIKTIVNKEPNAFFYPDRVLESQIQNLVLKSNRKRVNAFNKLEF